jgi:hypothetical protein
MAKEIPMGPKGEKRRISFNVIEDLSIINPTDVLPPLYMQYNPQSWNHSYKKIITRTQTLGAYVEEYWGDELDSISANATTGGFVIKDEIGGGYTTIQRRESQPFQKFQDILDIYNNNGNIYDAKGNIVKKGAIVMYYDEGSYVGFFESFNYLEDALNPYRFTFDFVFKVTKSLRGY